MEIKAPINYNPDYNLSTEQSPEYLGEIVNDWFKILKTGSAAPTYIPNRFIDCFYLYLNGSTYRLYIYINNEWKYSTLS